MLDDIDALPRQPFAGTLWRVAREGRDPLLAGRSNSRWCNGRFDVLYTSLRRDGAIAEIHALLGLQPVFPSKIRFMVHRLSVSVHQSLHLVDLPTLAWLGVDTDRYQERDYVRTQQIADATYFLGFDGMIVPSARWPCLNAILFSDRIESVQMNLQETEASLVDWRRWQRMSHRTGSS